MASTPRAPGKAQENQKRRARKALAALLARLRKGCDQFDTIDEWTEFVGERVKPVATGFQDVLPAETVRVMQAADQLTANTRAALQASCGILTVELERAFAALGGAAGGAGALAGGWAAVLGGALLLAAIGAFLYFTAGGGFSVAIFNQGCGTIVFPPLTDVLEEVPGVEIPGQIESGASGTVSTPIIGGQLQRVGDSLSVSALGFSYEVPLGTGVETIFYDGAPLAGAGAVPLTSGEHEIVLVCP